MVTLDREDTMAADVVRLVQPGGSSPKSILELAKRTIERVLKGEVDMSSLEMVHGLVAAVQQAMDPDGTLSHSARIDYEKVHCSMRRGRDACLHAALARQGGRILANRAALGPIDFERQLREIRSLSEQDRLKKIADLAWEAYAAGHMDGDFAVLLIRAAGFDPVQFQKGLAHSQAGTGRLAIIRSAASEYLANSSRSGPAGFNMASLTDLRSYVNGALLAHGEREASDPELDEVATGGKGAAKAGRNSSASREQVIAAANDEFETLSPKMRRGFNRLVYIDQALRDAELSPLTKDERVYLPADA